jgi:hypothetical protein
MWVLISGIESYPVEGEKFAAVAHMRFSALPPAPSRGDLEVSPAFQTRFFLWHRQ